MSRAIHCKAFGLIVIAGVGLACADPGTGPLNTSEVARGVSPLPTSLSSLEWQAQARRLVASSSPSMSPMAAARMYGALSVAQYLAVVAVDDGLRADGELAEHGLGSGGRALLEARRGAVAGASAEVLKFFFGPRDFDARVESEGMAGPGEVHPEFVRGREVGRASGLVMVERARNDKFTTPWVGSVPVGPEYWIVVGTAPAGAPLVHTTPYMLRRNDQFRLSLPTPPAFGSAEFAAAVAEVRGISDGRTQDQLDLARLWNYPAGTHTPAGQWNLIAADYIEADGMDERAATHVFALMHAAMFDATIACWDAKLSFWVKRPSHADPLITLPLGLPNHPSYPSGHSCLSAAARTVLVDFFPDGAHAAELNKWVIDAGLSRVYGGIHFGFDVSAGQGLGDEVGRLALRIDRSKGLLAEIR